MTRLLRNERDAAKELIADIQCGRLSIACMSIVAQYLRKQQRQDRYGKWTSLACTIPCVPCRFCGLIHACSVARHSAISNSDHYVENE